MLKGHALVDTPRYVGSFYEPSYSQGRDYQESIWEFFNTVFEVYGKPSWIPLRIFKYLAI